MREVSNILGKSGAVVKNGHFVGTSGKHMSVYINKSQVMANPKYVSKIGRLFAEKFQNKDIEAVVAPAVAGIVLSQWTAYYLSKFNKKEVVSLYTEKTKDNNQIFKRGYDFLVKNKRVLIVEDITTTGSSIKKVIRSVKKAGGRVIAASVMVNRDTKLVNSKTIRVPFSSLTILKIPSYNASNCPLCKKGIPINSSLGHGGKFLDK